MGTHKRPRVSREQSAALASTVPLDLTKKWLLPHLNLHELAEYACLGRAYPEITLDARIVAVDRRGSTWSMAPVSKTNSGFQKPLFIF